MVVFLLIDAFTEKHDSKISDIGDEDFFNRTPSIPLDGKVALLNLRKNTIKDAQSTRLVESSLEARMEFVLVHEQVNQIHKRYDHFKYPNMNWNIFKWDINEYIMRNMQIV